jgi:transcriptional regulator with XRE-family HTH domain
MAHPAYLRARARELRVAKHLSLDELAERLSLPKTTIYCWISDLPLGRERRASPGQRKGNLAMQAKYRRLREEAYEQGRAEYPALMLEPTFRDFVVLYIAEGFKRNRNCASIGNSDDRIVAMSAGWLARFSSKQLVYGVQYHADQDLDELRVFWGQVLGIDCAKIKLQRKSNSGQLAGRTWRSQHGVLTVGVNDTLFRARLQAWMDMVREEWRLDSALPCGA